MTKTQIDKTFNKIIEKINTAKSIAVFAHVNYDPDGLGSMYALTTFLRKQKKKVDMFVDSKITELDARFFDTSKISTEIEKEYDLMIMVDTPNINRLGKYASAFKNHPNTIRLDHHAGLFNDAKIELTLPYTSACEVVLELIERMNCNLDKTTATYLYAGILTDTDGFLIETVNKQTMQNVLKLIECGADSHKANDMLIKTQTLSQFNLVKKMAEKLEIYDGDIAISSLNTKDFKQANAKPNQCGNFANKLIYIDGVKISCLIKQEQNNIFSCSLRAKTPYNVAKIAEKFNGGGHVLASACKIKGTEKSVKQKILEAIREIK